MRLGSATLWCGAGVLLLLILVSAAALMGCFVDVLIISPGDDGVLLTATYHWFEEPGLAVRLDRSGAAELVARLVGCPLEVAVMDVELACRKVNDGAFSSVVVTRDGWEYYVYNK